jgi:hypothetical protein
MTTIPSEPRDSREFRRRSPWYQLPAITGVVLAVAAFATMCAKIDTITSQVESRPHAGSTYVTKTDFVVWQSGAALQRVKDSMINDYRLTRSDSLLMMLVRDCNRRGGCKE